MMEQSTLELNLVSAKDLKDLNLFSKMDVYAVVSLSDNQKVKTPVDRNGGTNPTWNFPVKLTFDESAARQNRLILEIKLRCERALGADKDIGQVHVSLRELLDQTGNGKSFQHVSYQVRKPSGKAKGVLNFSYKFSAPQKATAPPLPKADPVTCYPVPVGSTSSVQYPAVYPPQGYGVQYPAVYPPPPEMPQQGYGYPPQPSYGYPPQQSYGYAPQGYGYVCPPPAVVQNQNAAKNKFGMGLGAGLLGGALGGLLIGDMISDVGAYDGGYDAGFGDGFGF